MGISTAERISRRNGALNEPIALAAQNLLAGLGS